jgi:hypothetical protein
VLLATLIVVVYRYRNRFATMIISSPSKIGRGRSMWRILRRQKGIQGLESAFLRHFSAAAGKGGGWKLVQNCHPEPIRYAQGKLPW